MEKISWLVFVVFAGLLLPLEMQAQLNSTPEAHCTKLLEGSKYDSYTADSLILEITWRLRTSDSLAPCLLSYYRQKFVSPDQALSSQYYYNALANEYLRRMNPDSVRHYVKLALMCDSILGDTLLRAIDIGILGNLALKMGQLDEAIDLYNQQINSIDPILKPTNVSSTFNNLGVAYLKKGYLSTAMSYFRQAHQLSEMQANDYAIESSLNLRANVGIIHRRQSRYEEALELFSEVHKLAREHSFYYPEFLASVNIGTVYLELRQLDSAHLWLHEALRVAREENIDQETTLLRLAETAYLMGDLNGLQEILSDIDSFYLKVGYEWLPINFLLASYAAEMQGMETRCVKLLEKGLKLSTGEELSETRIEILEKLAQKYAEFGKHKESVRLLQTGIEERDSLKSMEDKVILADLTMQYQVDRYEVKLEKALAEAAMLAQQKTYYRIRFIFACGFSLLLALSFFLYYRQASATKKSLELEVGFLLDKATRIENENEGHRRTILDKNQQLTRFKNTVEDIVERYAPNARTLKRKLHILFNREVGRHAFREEFEVLFPQFSKVLLRDHPQLTDRQLEYAILIGMGLKSKEIGEVLHVTEKTVEKMRSRLISLFPVADQYSLSSWLRNKLLQIEKSG